MDQMQTNKYLKEYVQFKKLQNKYKTVHSKNQETENKKRQKQKILKNATN